MNTPFWQKYNPDIMSAYLVDYNFFYTFSEYLWDKKKENYFWYFIYLIYAFLMFIIYLLFFIFHILNFFLIYFFFFPSNFFISFGIPFLFGFIFNIFFNCMILFIMFRYCKRFIFFKISLIFILFFNIIQAYKYNEDFNVNILSLDYNCYFKFLYKDSYSEYLDFKGSNYFYMVCCFFSNQFFTKFLTYENKYILNQYFAHSWLYTHKLDHIANYIYLILRILYLFFYRLIILIFLLLIIYKPMSLNDVLNCISHLDLANFVDYIKYLHLIILFNILIIFLNFIIPSLYFVDITFYLFILIFIFFSYWAVWYLMWDNLYMDFDCKVVMYKLLYEISDKYLYDLFIGPDYYYFELTNNLTKNKEINKLIIERMDNYAYMKNYPSRKKL